jgi:predicted HicB family RNase H-like nuclease
MTKKPNKFAALTSEAFVLAAPENAGGRKPPPSDSRLTANINRELHLRLKLYAAKNYTSMGELIEEWIEQHIPQEPAARPSTSRDKA